MIVFLLHSQLFVSSGKTFYCFQLCIKLSNTNTDFILFLINRKNEIVEYFGNTNILSSSSHKFFGKAYWLQSNYINTYNYIKKGGTYMKTSKRKIPMYLFGSTIGATRYPLYMDDDGYHNLPRPYTNFKPGSIGRSITDSMWFCNFVEEVEDKVKYFLQHMYPDKKKAKLTLKLLDLSKRVIPIECRISNSCFTHMTLLGNLKDQNDNRHIHTDDDDIITGLFHIGEPTDGGSTFYYSGLKDNSPGDVQFEMPFQHGRLQIGFFNETLHAAGEWIGLRGGINLNIKKKVLSFFLDETKRAYYDQYKNNGFPNEFIAI